MRPALNFSPGPGARGSKLTVTEAADRGRQALECLSRLQQPRQPLFEPLRRPGGGGGAPGRRARADGQLHAGAARPVERQLRQLATTRAAAGARVVTPWGVYSVSYQKTLYQIGEIAAPLFPVGDIGIGSISGSQLVYADESLRIGVTEGWTHTDNVVSVFDGLFNLTDQHYDFLSFGVVVNKSFALFGENANVAAGPPFAGHLPAARDSLDAAGRRRAQSAFYPGAGEPDLHPIAARRGISFGFTWTGQWADSTMPQNQQWVLGGFGNLTAWLPAIWSATAAR